TGQPLDLSDAVARGSSPIHLEYLSNMGVQASLTVAIVVGEQLWGLIACHHYQPHFVDFRVRNMIKFLGQIASGQLVMQLSNDFKTQQLQTEKVRAQLFEALSQNWDIQEVIQQRDPGLLDLVDAGGAAIYFGETLKTLGDTPPATEIQGLIQELDRLKRGGVFATRSCQNEPLLAGVELPNTVGVLVLCISLAPYECMIWFRPEVREEVLWGGNPSKAVVHTEKGRRLSPRESFEKWKEVVEGQSRPWKSYELEVARSFGEDVKEVIIQKFNELKRLNAELSAAYEDLETFSYTVSHDLRAPLRGIAGFVDILREDYVEGFDERGHELMQTIIDNVGKMNAFITDILALARIGRHGLILNELPVRQIIHQIWEDRTAILPADRQVEFCLPDSMPSVVGDYTLLQQLFENILSNAIKYSQFESPARIEVDYTEDSQSVTYSIKDNGVGFDMKYADRIFEVFHRLVSDEDFKGTGIGLAIAKKVVSQHKGWIWVDSSPGVGTTFYIKLPKRVINQ
ncbi:MAG: GAF domain-containing protein, partial [Phaeodactylibacter sp.]|nr:GAF domain-containing protein [Phaeodactylibacter sp.]